MNKGSSKITIKVSYCEITPTKVPFLSASVSKHLTLQCDLEVLSKLVPHDGRADLAHVEVGGELVEHGCVRVAVLLNHRHNEGDQLVPEAKVLGAGSLLLRVVGVGGILHLELPAVQVAAVVKQELVRGLHARDHAVLHHSAGARRAWQILNLCT